MSNTPIPDAPPIVKKGKTKVPATKKPKKIVDPSPKPEISRQKTAYENQKVKEAMDRVKQAEMRRKIKEKEKADLDLSSSEESEYENDDFEVLEYVVKKKRDPIEVAPEFIKEVKVEVIKEVPVEKEVIKEVIKEVPVEKEVIKEVPVQLPLNNELAQQNQLLRHSLFMSSGLENINYMRANQKFKKKY